MEIRLLRSEGENIVHLLFRCSRCKNGVLFYDTFCSRCGRKLVQIKNELEMEEACAILNAALNPQESGRKKRNCDRFDGDKEKLHAAWWEWSGRPENCNPDGTVKMDFSEWLLAEVEEKE